MPDHGTHSACIYHYTTAATALEYILPSMTIRLNPIQDTNDPADGRVSLAMVSRGSLADPQSDAWKAYYRTLDLVHGDHRLACFTVDSPDAVNVPGEASSEFGWARDRMWAQYAAGHRGVCLCFDRLKLEQNAKALEPTRGRVVCGRVSYTDSHRIPNLDVTRRKHDEDEETVALRYRTTHAQALYFTKRQDWAGEHEYRVLLLDAHGTEPALIDVRRVLTAIYVGSRFSDAYRPCIEDLCRRVRIPAYQLYIWGAGAMKQDYVVP
jgi:hypothetical protein